MNDWERGNREPRREGMEFGGKGGGEPLRALSALRVGSLEIWGTTEGIESMEFGDKGGGRGHWEGTTKGTERTKGREVEIYREWGTMESMEFGDKGGEKDDGVSSGSVI